MARVAHTLGPRAQGSGTGPPQPHPLTRHVMRHVTFFDLFWRKWRVKHKIIKWCHENYITLDITKQIWTHNITCTKRSQNYSVCWYISFFRMPASTSECTTPHPEKQCCQSKCKVVIPSGYNYKTCQKCREISKHSMQKKWKRKSSNVLRHSRDIHPTWVKSFTKTLSNKVLGFWVQGQSPKGTLTVTDERWLTA